MLEVFVNNMIELIDTIHTKDELADFVAALCDELKNNRDEWENFTLECFLDAMEAWIRVIDLYAKNTGDIEVLTPSWKTFAKILFAAKVYE